MSEIAHQELVEQIHASGKQFLLSITGGGSRAIASLLEVPGASASVIGAIVPYAAAALESWLGGPVDQFCSERTARAMAMKAFQLARQFSNADVHALRGIGATASLATTVPKRGPHRIHVAWQSADTTVALSCELAKGQRSSRRGGGDRVSVDFVGSGRCVRCRWSGTARASRCSRLAAARASRTIILERVTARLKNNSGNPRAACANWQNNQAGPPVPRCVQPTPCRAQTHGRDCLRTPGSVRDI